MTNIVPITFKHGQDIKLFREAVGVSREEFCRLTGLDLDHLIAIEEGRERLSVIEFQSICNVWSWAYQNLYKAVME